VVTIRSSLHPHGRVYTLRRPAELSISEHEQLIVMQQRFAHWLRRPSRLNKIRMSACLGRVVSILLVDLEPEVLRRLPDSERRRVCDAYVEQAAQL
jgi:hypothetical protein